MNGVPPEVWRKAMIFVLTPDGGVWEIEPNGTAAWRWDSSNGLFGRASWEQTTHHDLMVTHGQLTPITTIEAMMVLMIRWVKEVEENAEAGLADHTAEYRHPREC